MAADAYRRLRASRIDGGRFPEPDGVLYPHALVPELERACYASACDLDARGLRAASDMMRMPVESAPR